MGKLMLSAIAIVIYFLWKYFSKIEKKNTAKKVDLFLDDKESFKVDFESIIVEGFFFTENVSVDVYDRESHFYKDEIYLSVEGFDLRGSHHKNKDVSKFSSQLIISFDYKEDTYKFKIVDLPINEITLRMKLYEQGYANIYVLNLIDEKANMSKVINANNQSNSYVLGDCFFLDFRFLNDQNIDIIKLGECKSC